MYKFTKPLFVKILILGKSAATIQMITCRKITEKWPLRLIDTIYETTSQPSHFIELNIEHVGQIVAYWGRQVIQLNVEFLLPVT